MLNGWMDGWMENIVIAYYIVLNIFCSHIKILLKLRTFNVVITIFHCQDQHVNKEMYNMKIIFKGCTMNRFTLWEFSILKMLDTYSNVVTLVSNKSVGFKSIEEHFMTLQKA